MSQLLSSVTVTSCSFCI